MSKSSDNPISQWQSTAIPMDDAPLRFDRILVRAKVMKQVLQRLLTAAQSDLPVLVLGETGTGKDLVAESIHRRSKRCKGPFVALNAASIPKDLVASELFGHEQGAFTGALRRRGGKLALAQGGTLFLDEVNLLDLQSQAAFLRVLENREYYPVGSQQLQRVDIRVIAASNVDLLGEVEAGRFRQDLYYRLEGFSLKLPPLRERRGAVPMLALEFLREVNLLYSLQVRTISAAAMARLEAFDWPGNVRELKSVIQRAVLLARSGPVLPEHLPERFLSSQVETPSENEIRFGPRLPLKKVEASYLRFVLKSCGGNKSEAAVVLGISRKALYEKLARES